MFADWGWGAERRGLRTLEPIFLAKIRLPCPTQQDRQNVCRHADYARQPADYASDLELCVGKVRLPGDTRLC